MDDIKGGFPKPRKNDTDKKTNLRFEYCVDRFYNPCIAYGSSYKGCIMAARDFCEELYYPKDGVSPLHNVKSDRSM